MLSEDGHEGLDVFVGNSRPPTQYELDFSDLVEQDQ